MCDCKYCTRGRLDLTTVSDDDLRKMIADANTEREHAWLYNVAENALYKVGYRFKDIVAALPAVLGSDESIEVASEWLADLGTEAFRRDPQWVLPTKDPRPSAAEQPQDSTPEAHAVLP